MNTLTDPNFATKTLLGFIGHFDLATVAHAREGLASELESAIQALACGDLDGSARKELIPLLAHNTTALKYLAGLLKGDAAKTNLS